MSDYSYLILVLIVPFISFLINGLAGHRFSPKVAGLIGTSAIAVTFIAALAAAATYFGAHTGETAYTPIVALNMVWLKFSAALHVDMGILVDPISVMMLVVVSTISLMVHIYSFGYMKGEPGFTRFYAYLSLFSFSMYGLVVATNIFQMYVFWELVGLSSFLLIGYYYDKPSAVAAAKKAFIVTRFADFGFLIGIIALTYFTQSYDFISLNDPQNMAIRSAIPITFAGMSVVTWALLLIFMGGAGKSAMFPLHIWLPDAMEGPTPVSALIHAATMVVAGVYLVARLFGAFVFSAPDALHVVGWVGGISSLIAAIIACTQTDIKRILAFSTMSQIGYMMLALGVSGFAGEEGLGFTASMFHLFTHAMFKALLFLGAGSVIHAIHKNAISDAGGLRKYMPITHITWLIACLAISGIPPFAGFFSKDEILAAAFNQNMPLYIVGTVVAGLTAFYMFRLYFSMFWGKDNDYHHTPHESPLSMIVPMIFLAVMSVVAGWIPFGLFVTPSGEAHHGEMNLLVASLSVLVAVGGIALAMLMYMKPSDKPEKAANLFGRLYTVIYRKFMIDEIYLFISKNLLINGVAKGVARFDRLVVDGFINSFAWGTLMSSLGIKKLQSGQLQKYGFAFVMSALFVVFMILVLIK